MKVTDMIMNKFEFDEFRDSDPKSAQKHGFIRYDNTIKYFQTPDITLVVGGIPKFNEKYHKKDSDRAYLKVPLDVSTPGGKALFDKFTEADVYFAAKQEQLFGPQSKNYEYQRLIRQPVIDDEETEVRDEVKSKYPPLPKLPTLKVKLDLDWQTDAIKSKVALRSDSGEITEPVIETIDDIAQYLRLGCEFKAVLAFSKYYAQKKAQQPGKPKIWGVTLKLRRIMIKPKIYAEKGGVQDDFIESDSEENEIVKMKKETKKVERVEEPVEEEQAEEEQPVEEQHEEEQLEEEQEEDLEYTKPVKKEPVKSSAKGKSAAKGKKGKLEL